MRLQLWEIVKLANHIHTHIAIAAQYEGVVVYALRVFFLARNGPDDLVGVRIVAWFFLPTDDDERRKPLCLTLLIMTLCSFFNGSKKFICIPIGRVIVLYISCIDMPQYDEPLFIFIDGSDEPQFRTGWEVSHLFEEILSILGSEKPITFRKAQRSLVR